MTAVPDEPLAEDAAAPEGSPERLSAYLLFDTVLLTLWLGGPVALARAGCPDLGPSLQNAPLFVQVATPLQ